MEIKKIILIIFSVISLQNCTFSALEKKKGLSFENNKYSTLASYQDSGNPVFSLPIASPPKNIKIKQGDLIMYLSKENFLQTRPISVMVGLLIPFPPIIPWGIFGDWSKNKCSDIESVFSIDFILSLSNKKTKLNKNKYFVKNTEIYLIKDNKITYSQPLPHSNYRGPREDSSNYIQEYKLFDRKNYKNNDSISLKFNTSCQDLENSKLFINGVYKNNKRLEIDPIDFRYKEGYVLYLGWMGNN
jgi:hypothetical protein